MKEMATHFSLLAWRIPWTEEPGRLHTVHGVAKNQTLLSDFHSLKYIFSKHKHTHTHTHTHTHKHLKVALTEKGENLSERIYTLKKEKHISGSILNEKM